MSIAMLIENLRTQAQGYETLVSILDKELLLPADCSLTELGNIQKQRDETVSKLAALEKERVTVFQSLFPSSPSVSLTQILPTLDTKVAKELTRLKEKLVVSVKKVKAISQKISERSLLRRACFLEARNFLQQNDKQRTYYSSQAKLRVANQSVLYDSKA